MTAPKKKSPAKLISTELTVGDVAQRSGISISAVHFYERKGLIKAWRTGGNQRRYPREVLRRIAVIRIAQRVGVPLRTIRETLTSLPTNRTPSAKDWDVLSRRWRKELDERITRLKKLRDEITGCIGCGCLSLDSCPLYNPGDKFAKQGPGPQLLDPDLMADR